MSRTPTPRPRRADGIYLDAAASTPIAPEVVELMRRVQAEVEANPSSIHKPGLRATRTVELARNLVAERLGVAPETLTFTSGATESNNLALKGTIWAAGGGHLVVSAIEHPSVLDVARWLEQTGQAEVTVVPVDGRGRVRVDDVEAALRPDTRLVSVMLANNEIGSVQPLDELGRLGRERGVLVHTDATQGLFKVPLDVAAVDLLTFNGHKIHGPKGVGALYVRPGVELTPLFHGGGHELGRRPGTLNVAGIAGLGEAVRLYVPGDADVLRGHRQGLLARLRERFPGVYVNGPEDGGLPAVLNVGFPGRSGKQLAKELDRRGIQVSASSACHATELTPSHVILALGRSPQEAGEALRISFGRHTRPADLDALLEALTELSAT